MIAAHRLSRLNRLRCEIGGVRTSALLLLLAASLAATACLTTERPAVVDTALQRGAVPLPVSGDWQNGDEHITWVTELRDSVTEVREQVTYGTDGVARRTITLGTNGTLLRFVESRSQTAQASDRSPTRMQVEMTLAFQGDSLVQQSKTVDGVDTPLRPYEVENARRHVSDLLATFAPTRPPSTPRN